MARLAIVATLALLVAGCGEDDDPANDATTTEAAETTTTTDEPDATTTTGPEEDLEPVGAPSSADKVSEDFPSLSGSTALLTDVEVGTHDGFDRVVWQFQGDDAPNYSVTSVAPPIRQDGSGNEVPVEGDAFIEVRLTPAAGFDTTSEDAQETYTGPDRLELPGAAVITEVVRIGDFEGQLSWVIGLEEPAAFGVAMLDDPLRFVVDVVTTG